MSDDPIAQVLGAFSANEYLLRSSLSCGVLNRPHTEPSARKWIINWAQAPPSGHAHTLHSALATTPSGQLLSRALSASLSRTQKACVMKWPLSASKARAGPGSPRFC